nr:hypothetical protein [Candidatus Kaiserbacteria bacterium]
MSSSSKKKKTEKTPQNLISAGDIAKEVGYTSDYITRLAREKKIKGKKVGKKWMVDPVSVAELLRRKKEEKELRSRALRRERKKEQNETPKQQATENINPAKGISSNIPLVTREVHVEKVSERKLTKRTSKKYFDIGLAARVHALVVTSGVMFAGVLLGVVGYMTPTDSSEIFSRARAVDTVAFVGSIGEDFFDATGQVAGTFSGAMESVLVEILPEPRQYVANVFWSDVWCGFKSLFGRECFFETAGEETYIVEEDVTDVSVVAQQPTSDRVVSQSTSQTTGSAVAVATPVTTVTNPVSVYVQELPDIFPEKWLDQITSREVHVIQVGGTMRSIESVNEGTSDQFKQISESFTTQSLTVDGDVVIKDSLTVGELLATSTISTSVSISSPYIVATSSTATSTFAGGLAVETTGFVYDYASNKVGIGTSAPETRLTLVQESDALGGGFRVNQVGDSDYFEIIGIADRVALGLNGTETFSFLENGSLGIGTSSPTYNLEVLGDARFTSSVDATYFTATSTTATSTFAGGLAVETTGFVYDYATNKVGIGTASPVFRFDVVGDGRFTGLVDASRFVATSTTATSTFAGGLTVDSFDFVVDPDSNRVGIGTTNLTSLLTLGYTTSIISTDSSDGSDSKRIQIAGGGTAGTERGASIEVMGNEYAGEAGDLSLYAGNSAVLGQGALRFFTGNVLERMTIDANGSVGIGTTSPAQLLSVAGNGYLTGGLGVGVATTTPGTLQTSGNGWIGGDLVVVGNSTVFGDSATLGESAADTLVINSSIGSPLIPTINATYDIGSPSFFWDDGYFDTITANNISAASSSISGTQSETFTINSNNATSDTESMDLIFYRGAVVPNALISWDATLDLFDINQPLFIQNDSSTTTIRTLDVWGTAGQTADLFRVASSTGTAFFNVLADGSVGVGTTSPTANFAVAGDAYFEGTLTASGFTATSTISAPYFVATDASATSTFAGGLAVETTGFVYDYATNKVGIGTASPSHRLHVVADTAVDHVANFESTDSRAFISFNDDATSGANYVAVGAVGDSLYFRSNNGDQMVLDSSGNVGVGTTSPSNRLHIAGSGTNTTVANLDSGGHANYRADRGSTSYDAGYFWLTDGSIDWRFQVPSASTDLRIRDESTGVDIITFENDTGNVGIGTTSPDRKLHIFAGESNATPYSLSQLVVENSGRTGIDILSGSSERGLLNFGDSGNVQAGVVEYDHSADFMRFVTNGSEKVRITSTGDVGVGTTSPFGNFVVHSSNSRYLNYLPVSGGLADFELVSNNNSQPVFAVQGTGTADLVNIFDDATEIFTIQDGGNVGIGDTTPDAPLDVVGSAGAVIRLEGNTTSGWLQFVDGVSNMGYLGYADDGGILTGAETDSISLRAENALHFGTNGNALRMTIDTSGNVGIGTTDPDLKLTVDELEAGTTYGVLGVKSDSNAHALYIEEPSGG